MKKIFNDIIGMCIVSCPFVGWVLDLIILVVYFGFTDLFKAKWEEAATEDTLPLNIVILNICIGCIISVVSTLWIVKGF